MKPERVLKVISDFILFARRDEELTKVVLRPHQMRAAGNRLGSNRYKSGPKK